MTFYGYVYSPYVPHYLNLTAGQDFLYPTNASSSSRTGDGMDFITAGRGTWQAGDWIDGGDGFDTITGYFPTIYSATGFMPTVWNVEEADLMSELPSGRIDFTNWHGLQYAYVHGTGNMATDNDTSFFNIPLNTKIGVTDFTHRSDFRFAGANGTQPADLTIKDVTNKAWIDIHQMADLHIHETGNNYFALQSESFQTITLDGNGKLAMTVLHGSSSDLDQVTKIDASGVTGSSVITVDQPHGVTIISGSGGTIASTTGNYADKIVFGAGADTYSALSFHNLSAPGVDLNSTAGLNAASIQISNFVHNQDKIDLTALGITSNSSNLAVDAHSTAQLNAFATLKAAAEFVAANDLKPANAQTVDVFQYQGSTYVFNDKNGDNHVDSSDGLIKIVNVTGITQTDFHA